MCVSHFTSQMPEIWKIRNFEISKIIAARGFSFVRFLIRHVKYYIGKSGRYYMLKAIYPIIVDVFFLPT